jgi:hypothetical protein
MLVTFAPALFLKNSRLKKDALPKTLPKKRKVAKNPASATGKLKSKSTSYTSTLSP